MTKLVTIGCKMPHGLTLEVGLEQLPQGIWGAPIQGKKYRKATLNGTHAEFMKRNPTIQPVATLNPEPGLTQIPEDFWEEWCKGQGKTHPARLTGVIFVVPDVKEEADAVLYDAQSLKSGFEPLDPDKLPELIEEAPVDGRPQLGSKPVRKD
jgi:hypothetical protein